MHYKNITAIHLLEDSIESLRPIIAFAQLVDAHLDIIVLAAAEPLSTIVTTQGPANAWTNAVSELMAQTDTRSSEINRLTQGHNLSCSITSYNELLGEVHDTVAHKALYSDLVFMNHGDTLTSGIRSHILKGSLFDAGKPVLILKNEKNREIFNPRKIMIAWHPDAQAMHAIQASYSLLQAADQIDIVMIDDNQGDINDGNDETQLLETYLKRHSLNAQVKVIPSAGRFVSHAVIDSINDIQPELLVLGAYGHPRIREQFFHGVTHDVLNESNTDLLLAH